MVQTAVAEDTNVVLLQPVNVRQLRINNGLRQLIEYYTLEPGEGQGTRALSLSSKWRSGPLTFAVVTALPTL